jgi:hypothetical protein
VHGGHIHVTGKAPDQLQWEFGLRLRSPAQQKKVKEAAAA